MLDMLKSTAEPARQVYFQCHSVISKSRHPVKANGRCVKQLKCQALAGPQVAEKVACYPWIDSCVSLLPMAIHVL